jgi:hypothetical protein
MSKSSLGGQYDLTANFASLSALLGVDDNTLARIELSVNPSHTAIVFLELSDKTNVVQIPPGVGYNHAFSAVRLGSIRIKGTPGDQVTLVGEEVARIEQGSMY